MHLLCGSAKLLENWKNGLKTCSLYYSFQCCVAHNTERERERERERDKCLLCYKYVAIYIQSFKHLWEGVDDYIVWLSFAQQKQH
jgi:hypothetical protein